MQDADLEQRRSMGPRSDNRGYEIKKKSKMKNNFIFNGSTVR